MARRSYSGGAQPTFLTAPIDTDDLSMLVNSTVGWPTGASGTFAATIGRGTATEEKVLCSASAAGTISISQRGYDGTTPKSHSATDVVEHTVTAVDLDESNAHVNANAGVHGLAALDRVVGEARAATLTNKTMSGTANTFTNLPIEAMPDVDAALDALGTADVAHTTGIAANVTAIAAEATARGAADTAEAATRSTADGLRYTKIESDARYEPIDTMYTKAESDALISAHVAALHADTGWIASTTGFTAATGFSLQTIKYRVVGKMVYLSATMTKTGSDLANTAGGNPTNTVLLSAMPAAVVPAQDQGFSSAGDDTTVSSRDNSVVVTASGTLVLTAMGGTADLTATTRLAVSGTYFKD